MPYFESISPLLQAGIILRQAGVACCIDVSDGLVQDAGHLCTASGIGMDIEVSKLPDWDYLCATVGEAAALHSISQGGEDYALLFTAPADAKFPDTKFSDAKSSDELPVCIGQCRAGDGVQLLLKGEKTDIQVTGFDHFK